MDVITIDFETFYDKDYSLSRLTTESYVNDKRFEIIGLAVKVNDKETVRSEEHTSELQSH